MTDFDFDIPKVRRRDTVEYPLKLGDRTFKLETRCSTIETPEVKNYVFARVRPDIPEGATAAERDAANIADMLETAGRCCIASWDVTASGASVECTPDRCVEFLQRARETFPDEVRAYLYFASNPANFREPIADASAVGKK